MNVNDQVMSTTNVGEGIAPQSGQPIGSGRFTLRQMRDELAREVNFRKSAYPSMVRSGRLTQQKADEQSEILHAIWMHFDERVRRESEERQNVDQGDLALGQDQSAERSGVHREPEGDVQDQQPESDLSQSHEETGEQSQDQGSDAGSDSSLDGSDQSH